MASFTQGAKEPFLVVLDHENPITKRRGRVLVLQLQQEAPEPCFSADAKSRTAEGRRWSEHVQKLE